MVKRVGVTNAKAHFSEVVDEVVHHNARVVIERRGKPVAVMLSIEELARLEGQISEEPTERRGALALVGAWSEMSDDEFDDFLSDIYRSRSADASKRDVPDA